MTSTHVSASLLGGRPMDHGSSEDGRIAPSVARVAARAIALVAVTCRGFIEVTEDRDEAETRRLHLCNWIERLGVANELEEHEASLIETPHGLLDQQSALDTTWRSEGLVVLAWSL